VLQVLGSSQDIIVSTRGSTVSKKGSVLVVDDEQSILGILEQFLTERGYEVVTAGDGSEALAQCSTRDFDIALIDLKLPDQNGLDLMGLIKKEQPGIHCIVMTAFASLESTIEALRLNAFDYVLKPFDLVQIGEIVEAAYSNLMVADEKVKKIQALEETNKQLEESREDLHKRIVDTNEELAVASESIKKHVTRLKMLYQMGRDISANEDWGDSLDRFLMALCTYIEAEGAGLLLFSHYGRVLKVRTSYQIDDEPLKESVNILLDAHGKDFCSTEVFHLESCAKGEATTCLAMKKPWDRTIIPLIYKGRWLGFLLVKKRYATRRAYLNDYHFVNTIQTILTEEVANAVNISRLRNLKNFNETVLENINSGVLSTDNNGGVVFLNGKALEMLGETAGMNLRFDELFSNPITQGSLFEHLVNSEGRSTSFEGTMALPDGGMIPVRLNTTVVEIDDYHGKTVVAVFEDLTEQKAMEEELRRADRLRSLGELSAGVAHEIRNPLTGIATTAQVLREKLAGRGEEIEYIDVILQEIKRLDDIINNLLIFARPLTPDPSELNLANVLNEALQLLEEEADGRRVSLRLENGLDDDTCLLDGDQIKQVVLNLVLNGLQACGEGGEVIISLRESERPAMIEMVFSDTGEGITAEAADKLYNPFFTTRSEGTGLGLSISRKIVESHHGSIHHESEPGKGTRFFIELPRRVATPIGTVEETTVS
jgi:PAS domain S-box-containing protein